MPTHKRPLKWTHTCTSTINSPFIITMASKHKPNPAQYFKFQSLLNRIWFVCAPPQNNEPYHLLTNKHIFHDPLLSATHFFCTAQDTFSVSSHPLLHFCHQRKGQGCENGVILYPLVNPLGVWGVPTANWQPSSVIRLGAKRKASVWFVCVPLVVTGLMEQTQTELLMGINYILYTPERVQVAL